MGVRQQQIFCRWRARRDEEDFYGTGKAPRWRGGSMINVTRNVQGHDTTKPLFIALFAILSSRCPRISYSCNPGILRMQR
jgi:hypothetical protein